MIQISICGYITGYLATGKMAPNINQEQEPKSA